MFKPNKLFFYHFLFINVIDKYLLWIYGVLDF